ncbi:MAG: hypothetical protein P4L33_03505 [Capsulimonadaceae bacterium]|nr:hypothetical protein [Capsulimonadaceae bacterium]
MKAFLSFVPARCLARLLAPAVVLVIAAACAVASDTAPDHVYDVTPSIVSFHQNRARSYTIVFAFDVREKLPPGAGTFVHFTRGGELLLQYGTGIETAPESWQAGQIVKGKPTYCHFPVVLADGEYPILVGIWTPANGQRLHLKGIDDGQQRYQAGILVVKDHGRTLSLTGAPPIGPDAAAAK